MKLFCDLHIHSCLSPCGDGLMTPNNIVGMAFIKQLSAIAVCDHNTARNLPAIKEVADMMGVVLLPGMELTTREEAHMLAYFKTVEEAVAFSDVIYAHLPPIPNNAKFFGEQQRMNAQDEVVGIEERLLISALDLSFEECAELIHAHGGLCVPAHINRGSNGCLNALGFLPSGVAYDALEISRAVAPPAMDVSGYRVLHSSDAHYLENILEPEFTIEAADRSAEALFHAIQGKT
ncbi:MAG: PHP domain-containing protein [Clostridia bacterium]|nr:PHP domain-containing protein [Clostridia bacterium]